MKDIEPKVGDLVKIKGRFRKGKIGLLIKIDINKPYNYRVYFLHNKTLTFCFFFREELEFLC